MKNKKRIVSCKVHYKGKLKMKHESDFILNYDREVIKKETKKIVAPVSFAGKLKNKDE